jgi:uncharacterized protein YjbI with pentapeptide repeats
MLRRLSPGGPTAAAQHRGRWSDQQNRAIAQMLHDGSVDRHALPGVEIHGSQYVDLRGILVSQVEVGHGDVSTAPLLTDLDLSYCLVELGGFSLVRMRNCRFVRARMGQWLGGYFERCDFSGAIINVGMVCGEFVDCQFVGATIRSAVMGNRFVRCDFSGADLTGTEFGATKDAVDCRFDACVVSPRTFLPPGN